MRVIARLNIGGPARHAVILQQGLSDAGYESVLVHGTPTPDEGSFEPLLASRGLTSVRLAGLGRRVNAFDDVVAFCSLLSLVFREQPDILHTHTAKAGILGRWAAKLAGVPLIFHTAHGFGFNDFPRPAIRNFYISMVQQQQQ